MSTAPRFDNNGHPTPAALEDERRLQARFTGYQGVDADSSQYITGQTLLVDGGISTGATRATPRKK